MKTRKHITTFIAGGAVLMLLAAVDLLHGGSADKTVMLLLRAPRTATAMIAGAALALAGSQMQNILRNPLADPHIMGVSSGAALGAAVAIIWGNNDIFNGLPAVAAAILGASISATIILLASRTFRSTSTLLIFGVMFGFIVNAIISILQFTSDAESLKIFYSWSAGSFSNTTWPQIAIMTAALMTGYIIAFSGRKGLDIILFGDEFARMSGADVTGIRLKAILGSCILTGAVTAFCGPLGFAGIVAPHIARSLFRTSASRTVLPASMLTGALLSTTADLLSQLSPTPVPVASTMAITGIPIIIYILIKKP